MENLEKKECENLQFFGSLKLRPGQKLFAIHKTTFEVKIAMYESLGDGRHRLIVDKEFWYCPAINERNAMRKFANMAVAVFQQS